WQPAKHDANFAKEPALTIVHRMIGHVCAREMAHHQRKSVVLGMKSGRESGSLIETDAKTVPVGIHMQSHAPAPVRSGDEGIPFRKLGSAVDHRPNRGIGKASRSSRHHAIE